MVMLRASGKAQKIAKRVLNQQGVAIPKAKGDQPLNVKPQFLHH